MNAHQIDRLTEKCRAYADSLAPKIAVSFDAAIKDRVLESDNGVGQLPSATNSIDREFVRRLTSLEHLA